MEIARIKFIVPIACLALIFSTQTNSPAETKTEEGKTPIEQFSPDAFKIILQISTAENRIKENIDDNSKKLKQDIEKLKDEIIPQLNEMQKKITAIEDILRQNGEKKIISLVEDIKKDLKRRFNLLSFVIVVVFITLLVSLILTSKRYKRKRYF